MWQLTGDKRKETNTKINTTTVHSLVCLRTNKPERIQPVLRPHCGATLAKLVYRYTSLTSVAPREPFVKSAQPLLELRGLFEKHCLLFVAIPCLLFSYCSVYSWLCMFHCLLRFACLCCSCCGAAAAVARRGGDAARKQPRPVLAGLAVAVP